MAIVTLYKVIWRTNGRNAANIQTNTDYVVAPANTKAEAMASTIQTNNGDGKTVTVDHVYVVQAGVIQ